MAAARKMKARLVTALGGSLTFGDAALWAFPEPADVLKMSEGELGECIGHALKGQRVHAVATAFLDIHEAFLKTAPEAEVRAWLESIDGIGPWSASFVMVRGLGRTGSLVGIEEELLPAVAKVYGVATNSSELRSMASRYGAWQGYWAHYLRVAA
jgi:DNA-3-methyladenine glycosylase II